MKKIVVTGGRGFIGSNLAKALQLKGVDIIVVDAEEVLTSYLSDVPHSYINREAFLERITNNEFMGGVECIVHLGACSSTLETNREFLLLNNTEYSKKIAEQCARFGVRLIYASSAATYGDGSCGFRDTERNLRPLNYYGLSKYLFDDWILNAIHRPPQWVGLKFFNVYGPHEDHKSEQASVPFRKFFEVLNRGYVELYKSYRPEYANGGQLRDFIYIDDVIRVLLYFLSKPSLSGIFNVGTGNARSFLDLARALFTAMERKPDIRYIDMPERLKAQYQYFTQADISSLRATGYDSRFTNIEEGVDQYVKNYLVHMSQL